MQKVQKSRRAAFRNLSILGAAAATSLLASREAQATWTGIHTNTSTQSGATSDYNNLSNWAGGTIDDTFGAGALVLNTTYSGTTPSTVASTTIYFSANRTTTSAAGVSYTDGPYGLDSFTIGANGFVDASVVAGTNTTTATLDLVGGGTDGGAMAASHTLTLNGNIVDVSSSMNGTTVEASNLDFADAIYPELTNGININLNGATRTLYAGTATSGHTADSIYLGYSTGSGGIISDSTGNTTTGIIKDGDGRIFVQSAQTYYGPTTIGLTANFGGGAAGFGTSSSYGLEIEGAYGSIANSSEINVNAYESLAILDTAGNDRSNRLNSSAPLNLFSGNYATTGVGGAAFSFSGYTKTTAPDTVSETIGSLNFNSNVGLVDTGIHLSGTAGVASASTMILTAGSLGRSNGALGVFANVSTNGILLGTNGAQKNMVLFTNAPTTIGGSGATNSSTATNQAIIPWLSSGDGVTGGNVTFLTYDTNNGLTPLQTTNYYSATLASNTDPTNNIRVTTADTTLSTSSATITINSLNLTKAVTLGTNGATLDITSGAILISTASNITGGTLAFGSTEGIINTRGGATTITSNITGSGGLTVGGGNALASFTHVGALGYTGTTNVEGLGASFSNGTIPTSSPIVVQPGSLLTIGAGTSGTPNNQVINSLSGGSYLVQGKVNLGNATYTSLNLGTSTGATVNTVTMNGLSTFISPGLSGTIANDPTNTSARIGTLQIANNGGVTASNLSLLNGNIDIDLASNPSSQGGLGLPSNDLIEVTGNTSLNKGGNLGLAVSGLSYVPAVGTQFTILVSGNAATSNTVTNLASGDLFNTVTSNIAGRTFSAAIGNYGTGTNDAIILTTLSSGPSISLTASVPATGEPLITNGTSGTPTAPVGVYSPTGSGSTLTVAYSSSGYVPGYIHGLTASSSPTTGIASGYTATAGFHTSTETQIYLLKLDVNGTVASAGQDAQIAADIEAADDITAVVPTGTFATLGGTAWSIELEFTNPGFTSGYLDFNFSGYSDATSNISNVTATDVAAVPEPTALGLIGGGALVGMLTRRSSRRRKSGKAS